MNIKVLGPGCANCTNLQKLVQEVVGELGVEASVEKITDFKEIAKYGIMSTPGLVINEVVKWSGSVPNKAKVNELITTELAKEGS
jgi:small redox-active disulfide protein 2